MNNYAYEINEENKSITLKEVPSTGALFRDVVSLSWNLWQSDNTKDILEVLLKHYEITARIKEYLTFPMLVISDFPEILSKDYSSADPSGIDTFLHDFLNKRRELYRSKIRQLIGYPEFGLPKSNDPDNPYGSYDIIAKLISKEPINAFPSYDIVNFHPTFYFYKDLSSYNSMLLESQLMLKAYIQQTIGYILSLLSMVLDEVDIIITNPIGKSSPTEYIEKKQVIDEVIEDASGNLYISKSDEGSTLTNATCNLDVTVSEIIDGDTIRVKYISKSSSKEYTLTVRFAMINAPEISTEEGKQSFEFLKQLISVGDKITISFSLINTVDPYGRLIAFVIRDGKLINEIMLKENKAEPLIEFVDINSNNPYVKQMLQTNRYTLDTLFVKKPVGPDQSLFKIYNDLANGIVYKFNKVNEKVKEGNNTISSELLSQIKEIIDALIPKEGESEKRTLDNRMQTLIFADKDTVRNVLSKLDDNLGGFLSEYLLRVEIIFTYIKAYARKLFLEAALNLYNQQSTGNMSDTDKRYFEMAIDNTTTEIDTLTNWMHYLGVLLNHDILPVYISQATESLSSKLGLTSLLSLTEAMEALDEAAETTFKLAYGMERAYPTFKLFLVEEDSDAWLCFDDFYAYNAVQSIKIVKSRKAASSTAEIVLSNISNVLSFKSESTGIEFIGTNEFSPSTMPSLSSDTAYEQFMASFPLQVGSKIVIKLGYSNNLDEMPTVFIGKVVELTPGEVIRIVAQDYGAVLLEKPTKEEDVGFHMCGDYRSIGDVIGWALRKINVSDSLGHFSIFDDVNMQIAQSHFSRRQLSKFITNHLSFVNNINDALTDNVYLPMGGKAYAALTKTRTFSWYIHHEQTTFDVIQEALLYTNEYICKVMPYNDEIFGATRQTLYIGPKDGYYKASDITNPIENALLNNIIEESKKILNELRQKMNKIDEIAEMEGSSRRTVFMSQLKQKLIEEGKIFKTLYETMKSRTSDLLSNSFDVFSNALYLYEDRIGVGFKGRPSIWSWFYLGKNPKFGLKDATVSILPNLIKQIMNTGAIIDIVPQLMKNNAMSFVFDSYKKVTKSHFYDSIHHIIDNSITAGSEEFYNKVIMFYPSHNPVADINDVKRIGIGRFIAGLPWMSRLDSIELYADDDIFIDDIREYSTFQKNIDSALKDYGYRLKDYVAYIAKRQKQIEKEMKNKTETTKREWAISMNDMLKNLNFALPIQFKVGLNILANTMREMYGGQLVIIGDPTVEPYDTVYIYDAYNNMQGIIDVEEVIHSFDASTGYITIIKPDLRVHVKRKNKSYHDDMVKALYNTYSGLGWIVPTVPGIATGVVGIASFKTIVESLTALGLSAGPVGWIATGIVVTATALVTAGMHQVVYNKWRKFAAYVFGREMIEICGLFYGDRPFIAGMRGARTNTILSHYLNSVLRVGVLFTQITGLGVS